MSTTFDVTCNYTSRNLNNLSFKSILKDGIPSVEISIRKLDDIKTVVIPITEFKRMSDLISDWNYAVTSGEPRITTLRT